MGGRNDRFDHTPTGKYRNMVPQSAHQPGPAYNVQVTVSPHRGAYTQKKMGDVGRGGGNSYSHLRDKLNSMKKALQ